MNNLANHQAKKRKYESPNGSLTPSVVNGMTGMSPQALLIKAEPGLMGDCDDDGFSYEFCADMAGGGFMDGAYQVIKWSNFQPKTWVTLLDHNYKEL